jgi:hypothetical protein
MQQLRAIYRSSNPDSNSNSRTAHRLRMDDLQTGLGTSFSRDWNFVSFPNPRVYSGDVGGAGPVDDTTAWEVYQR